MIDHNGIESENLGLGNVCIQEVTYQFVAVAFPI